MWEWIPQSDELNYLLIYFLSGSKSSGSKQLLLYKFYQVFMNYFADLIIILMKL